MARAKKTPTKKKAAAKRRRGTGGSANRKSTRPYPKVPLAKAVEIPQKIKELNGGNPWTPADVATAIGMGAKSADFYYVTAASRDFGLTVGTRDSKQIELAELGRDLVYASGPEEEKRKRVEAFQKIELFNKVLAHYKGSDLPEMKYLGNTLKREFGLEPEHHEEFSIVFRENCEYLGLTSGIGATEEEQEPAGTPTTVVVGEQRKKTGLKAFVIMPFTEKNSERHAGFFDEVLRSLVTPAGLEAGFTVTTANRQGSDVIQSTIVNELLSADLVIADLTDHNPNVLFELGLRIAEELPVALIKAADTGRIFDVDNLLRVFEYKPNLWRSTLETDLPAMTDHIKAAWGNKDSDQSYLKILRRTSDDNG